METFLLLLFLIWFVSGLFFSFFIASFSSFFTAVCTRTTRDTDSFSHSSFIQGRQHIWEYFPITTTTKFFHISSEALFSSGLLLLVLCSIESRHTVRDSPPLEYKSAPRQRFGFDFRILLHLHILTSFKIVDRMPHQGADIFIYLFHSRLPIYWGQQMADKSNKTTVLG